MGLSPWPIRVPRIGVILSGIRIPKQPARPSWPSGQATLGAAGLPGGVLT